MVVLYDQPDGIEGAAGESWAAVREGIHAGAAASPVPVMVTSTLPELLDDAAAARFAAAGMPAIAGCAPAWLRGGAATAGRRPGAPARDRRRGGAARGSNGAARWPSTRPRSCCVRPGVPVVEGRLAAGEEDAAGAMEDLAPALVLKLSAPTLMHKSELRALALDLRSPEDVRAAYRRLVALGGGQRRGARGANGGAGLELLVSARATPWCPRWWWASAACGPRSTTTWPWCRCRPRRSGWRRHCAPCAARASSPAPAAARRSTWQPPPASAPAVGDLLLAEGLALIELNPVLVHEHGALAVDALAG